MAKFHFRLATLLRIRETARDERRVELAEVQRTEAELHRRWVQLDAQRKQLQHECRQAAGPGPVYLPRLTEAQRYGATLRTQAIDLQEQRRTLAVEVERRRGALIEADAQVRTLEKLRENQWETHRQDEERQESKRLDETALQTAHSGVC